MDTIEKRAAENAGNKYVVCRSLDDFIITINEYLAQIEDPHI